MKFAYLIMAHDNIGQLKNLLKVLDYEENEIFLHVDKKSKSIKNEELHNGISRAKLHIYQEYSVYWADISQTICQVFLLREASKTFHDYYHLLSGHDLPIKSHEEILTFFEKNKGKQFVHFESEEICLKENCRYFHFWDSLIKKELNSRRKKVYEVFERISIQLQKKMSVKRNIYCGANWYSITQELAEDFCKNSDVALRKVRWTVSSDEYILQTFLMVIAQKKYDFYAKSYNPYDYRQINREIDWNRGTPYVWRTEDYEYLLNSEAIFARKFDENIDNVIINRISEFIRK